MNNSISIILPVYNAEKYLQQCIDSIQRLSKIDWELILVDDESKDKSAEICDAAANERIKVFHIQNKGVSNARNFGLSKATKDAVTFIDADDWIDAIQFENAFKTFIEFDTKIAFTPFTRVTNCKRNAEPLDFGETRILSNAEKDSLFYKRLGPGINLMGSVWRVFYKRTLIQDIAFDTELHYNEDVHFVIHALHAARNAAIINTAFYYYRENETSATFNKAINNIDARESSIQKLEHWAKANGIDFTFSIMRRRCPIYARKFAKAANEHKNGRERRKALKEIHKSIPKAEYKLWKPSYFGKSFAPYALLRSHGFEFFSMLFLFLRFIH